MNAIELLKDDHQKVLGMLEKLADTTDRAEKTRTELLAKIEKELQIHTQIEEEIFYPAFRQAGHEAGKREDEKMFHEATEEHRAVEALVLPDLLKTDPSSTAFAGRAKVLKELVEHHAEEEEKSMFPEARKLLGEGVLKTLGEAMAQRKKELMAQTRDAA
ncbi:hemerythrin domain-containing protein [Pseudomonas mangrovi]|mgnify:CR=1 FL=1|uniref:Hemerythrin n=1 Tax=Pseudomonas mangrovi TaxID=2161748 RepID=A0A2T5P6U6_9PSED|nr:hemerythrin domain-containing protein [Pseudomonas mangrovi]PTU73469.1 hemerythrin [Pseudomonas mangrovi]